MLRRPIGALWAAAFCWAAFGPRFIQAEDAPPEKKPWSALPCLPADTLAVLSLKNLPQAAEALQKTGLWQVAVAPEVAPLYRRWLERFRDQQLLLENLLGAKLGDLAALLQGELTIAYFGPMEGGGAQAERNQELLLALQVGAKELNWLDQVQKLIAALNVQLQGNLQIKQLNFNGVDVTSLSAVGIPFTLHYAVDSGTFLLATRTGRIEGVLAARQALQEAAAPPEITKTLLAANPSYQRALDKTGADLLAWVNFEALRKHPLVNLNPKNEKQQRDWGILGLDRVKGFAYGLALREKGFREVFFVDAPARERSGLMSLLDSQPLKPETIETLPGRTLLAAALRYDLKSAWEKFLALLPPEARQNLTAAVARAEQDLAFNFKQDLLEGLTGEVTVSVVVPHRNPKLPVGLPRPVLSFGAKDAASGGKLVELFKRATRESHEFAELAHGAQRLAVFKPIRPEDGPLCFVVLPDRLLASLYPLALREELDRLAEVQARGTERQALLRKLEVPKAGGEALTREEWELLTNPRLASLLEDRGFKEARARLSKEQNFLLYADAGSLLTALYDLLVPLAQMNAKLARDLDLRGLPTSELVERNAEPLLLGLSADADGLRIEISSATGVAGLIPAVLGMQRGGRGPVRDRPPPEPAKPGAQEPPKDLPREF